MTWLLGKPPRTVVEFKFVRIEYQHLETSKKDVVTMSETLRFMRCSRRPRRTPRSSCSGVGALSSGLSTSGALHTSLRL